jgi:hypothetical protein
MKDGPRGGAFRRGCTYQEGVEVAREAVSIDWGERMSDVRWVIGGIEQDK